MQELKRVLFIGTVWPEPTSSAAGSRMLQIINFFLKQKWHVTFVSAAAKSEFSADLKKLGVTSLPVKINSPDFDGMIKQQSPNLVIFDRFMTEEQFGWRVADNCPNAIRVLDTEDLHCLRVARQNAFKKESVYSENDLLTEEITKREIASIYRSDLSLIISDYEYSLLTNLFGIDESLLHYMPFLLDKVEDTDFKKLPGFEERDGFMHIGNFLHEPNWNAVLWLKEELWPLIRSKLPNAKLSIYGSYPSQKVHQLHNEREGFLIKGRAESSFEVLKNSKVLLAPLRFGAGLKGKLVEAMQCGTPSVTTEIGAEGIAGDLSWPGMIGNTKESISESAVQLYLDKSLWTDAQRRGFEIINKRFNREEHEQRFKEKLEKLKNDLKSHRTNNFTGRMLMHHSSASTRFMSKWIEEKNRKK